MGEYVPTPDESEIRLGIDRLVGKFRLSEIAIATKDTEFRAIAFSRTHRSGIATSIRTIYGAITRSPLSAIEALEEKLEASSGPAAASKR